MRKQSSNLLLLVTLCIGLAIPFAHADPTYDQQILQPDTLSTDSMQFPCALAVTHDGLGAVSMSRDLTTNSTVATVYEINAAGVWVQRGAAIVVFTFSTADAPADITCSVATSDDLNTFVVSIATNTPASTSNPAKTNIYQLDPTNSAAYLLIQALTTSGNISQAKAVAMSADAGTIYLSEPATVFENSRVRILKLNVDNGSYYDVIQDLVAPINVSSLGASWTEDIAASTDGNTFIANSPYAPHIYIYSRDDSASNFTFVDRVAINITDTPFTSIALAGDGLHIFATYHYEVTEVDNSTTLYNGIYRWSYDASLLAWDPIPDPITYGVGVLNTTTNITIYTYSRYIHSPVSACFRGSAIIAPTYNSSFTSAENITFTALSLDETLGEWVAVNFPVPTETDWLLTGVTTVQQISPTTGSGIGFNRILSDLGDVALVPTQQVNNTQFAYWISAYSAVADCTVVPTPTAPTSPVAPTASQISGYIIAGAAVVAAAVGSIIILAT